MTSERRLSIAVVAACPIPQPRGTPVRILRLSEALAKLGHDVHLITYYLGDGELPADLHVHRSLRVPIYRKRTPGPSLQKLLVMDPLLALKLSTVVRQGSFDVVHAHHYEGLIAAVVSGVGAHAPVVYDAHTMLESELPSYALGLPRRWKARLGGYLDRRLPGHADHVIAVTDTIRRKLIADGMAAGRVTVASGGVEDEFFDACDAAPAADGTRPPTLVFAGNLAAYQGIELLLAAFRDVLAARPDARLLLLTESDFAPYEDLARELGVRDGIELRSARVEELPVLLRTGHIAMNPRVDCDGIPMKLLNYMAAARPVVSFAGSAPVLRNGENGLVVGDGDTAAFAHAILQLLDDARLRARLGARARDDAETHHRWSGTAERVESVFRRLIDGRGIGAAHDARPRSTPARG